MNEYVRILDKYFTNEKDIENELVATLVCIDEKKKLAYDNAWIVKEAIRRGVSYDAICIEIDNDISTLKKYVKAFREYLKKEQIITCVECQQRIKIETFKTEAKIKCPKCASRLKLVKGEDGKIKVIIIEKRDNKNSEYKYCNSELSIPNCLNILGLSKSSSFDEIKKAYRNLIAKYHPDKVNHLGDEFKILAERKTKEINTAFSFLKEQLKTR